MRARLTAVLIFAAAASVAVAGASSGASAAARVVHRGEAVILSVSFPPSNKTVCLAEVHYVDGAGQQSGIKRVAAGRVKWTIRVPNNAALGLAHWSVRCGPKWQRAGTWRVVARPVVVPALPTVSVLNDGFSQRPDKFGGGSKVSYGIFLKNSSAQRDADNVYLLVNFVGANGELLGSAAKTVPVVVAGSSYAFGDEMSLRTQVAVAKLEVTVRVTSGEPSVAHPLPHFTNVRILPDSRDPAWVAEVDGEIVNDSSPRTMSSAKLSFVVLDASGDISGGGTASMLSPLPAGSRMVFLATSGFTAVPVEKAKTVVISVLPDYQAN